MSPADERKDIEDNPVGERPQDIRSRTETIKERDAKHLTDEARYGTSGIDDADQPADPPVAPAGGAQRRGRAQTADGKPYADSQDPDSRSDGVSNTGSGLD